MSPVEYIICQTNHLNQFKDRLGARISRPGLSFTGTLGRYLRTRGLNGLFQLFSGSGSIIDVTPYVERNLKRREIRLANLFGNRLVKAIYRTLVGIQARLMCHEIAALLDRNPQATALIFNGFLMPGSLLAGLATARNQNRLYLEKGFFPNTIQCDRKGINCASSLSRDPAFYRWVAPMVGAARPEMLVRRRSKRPDDTALSSLPERFIFVPFQVPSDMQILAHSPFVRDMEHFYEIVFEAAEALPDRVFVVKEHPSFALSIRNKVRPHPRILFANSNETRELIESSACVLTINSTVGLEALTLGRKVVTLGDAPYNVKGLVQMAASVSEVIDRLSALDTFTPDEALRDTFIGYVFNEFLLHGDMMEPGEALESQIRSRAEGRDRHSRLLSEFQIHKADSEHVPNA